MPWTTPTESSVATWSGTSESAATWSDVTDLTAETWSDGTTPYALRDLFIPIHGISESQPSGFAEGRRFVYRVATPAEWYVSSDYPFVTISSRVTEHA